MNTVYIPANYTDAGKLFGMFAIRNMIECVILCIPLALFTVLLSPFGITGTIISVAVIVIPVGGFAVTGVQDYSLFTFLRIYNRFKKNKRILTYRGTKWIKTKA